MIHLDRSGVEPFLDDDAFRALHPRVVRAHETLLSGAGAGSEFLGWRTLLAEPNDALLGDIDDLAAEIRAHADVFLCIGIGGSYLGARAVISALMPYFLSPEHGGPEILFAGHHLSGAYLRELLAHLEGRSVYVNVVSKSGTTLEPAIAFRVVREWMGRRFEDAARRIVVTTDPEKGALNRLRASAGYRRYVIPPDVGGRFSVLSPAGLLPIAVAGVDIRALFYGAVDARRSLASPEANPALDYAATRFLLHESTFTTELLAVFEPRLSGLGAWWQQLFGESEGKEHKGLFPVPVQYSTDLHSVGQYVQDGRRNVAETFLLPNDDAGGLVIPGSPDADDGLDFVAGRTLSLVNRKAAEGTIRAHVAGGVPVQVIRIPSIDPTSVGGLLYFFEHAVSVSGYLLGVNPFDQPGVEAYKREMYSLLGQP
jgi:glucose-6-phosphate isomerase